MAVRVDRKAALVVVDVQRDFCPGGALPVTGGDEIIPALNRYISIFERAGLMTLLTRDWHPPDHESFKPCGGTWPPHCVKDTLGAEFHPKLRVPTNAEIVSKADKADEAYSFLQGTDMASVLRKHGIRALMVGGLATDYCVKATVMDGLKHGFEVYFLEDASKGVDVKPGDSERAIAVMVAAGAKRTTLQDVEASGES